MNDETIQELVKEVVAQFVNTWEDTPQVQVVERDGDHFFIFKLPDPLHYASLHLSLEERCENLLTDFYENLRTQEPESEDDNADLVKTFAYRLPHELTYLATNVPSFLAYSLYLLNVLTQREHLQTLSESFTQDAQAKSAQLAGIVTEGLLQRHDLIEKRRQGAPSVIDSRNVLDVFLRLRGDMPSIRLLAKELNTTPSTVRTWLRSKGFESPKELIYDLYKRSSIKPIENGSGKKKGAGRN
jgi:hypothetical protein